MKTIDVIRRRTMTGNDQRIKQHTAQAPCKGQRPKYLAKEMRSLQNAQCAEETSQDQTARQTKPSQATVVQGPARKIRSEEHTSELQSLMRISYAVFCLKKKPHTIVKKQTKQ